MERVINLALQAGCQRPGDFNDGVASEYPLVSPVIGTVNLEDAHAATGAALETSVITTSTGNHIPQRNNMILTAGFALGRGPLAPNSADSNPGFDGRLRAFRAFKPVPDNTKPSGYTFTKDGTPLWPDRGRPARTWRARRGSRADSVDAQHLHLRPRLRDDRRVHTGNADDRCRLSRWPTDDRLGRLIAWCAASRSAPSSARRRR